MFKFIQDLEAVKEEMREKKDDHVENIVCLIQGNRRQMLDPNRDYHSALSYQYSSSSSKSTASSCNSLEDPGKVSRLHLTLEHLPTSMYNERRILDELVKDMPMTAMLKHVSHMSVLGMFEEDDVNSGREEEERPLNVFTKAFENPRRVIHSFMHPFQILKALMAYEKGRIF